MLVWTLVTALLWGVTNPLLKRYSADVTTATASTSLVQDMCALLSRPKYLLAQLANLAGSLAFFLALRTGSMCVCALVANTLTFVVTVLMSVVVLREGTLSARTSLGCACALAGVSLCTYAAHAA